MLDNKPQKEALLITQKEAKMNIKLIIPLILVMWSSTALGADISFVVKRLNSDKGAVVLTLYSDSKKEAFPDKTENALCIKRIEIKDWEAQAICEAIPAGTYAASVWHDENDNKKFDKNLMGIPKEGYGFSNDAVTGGHFHFRPPDFEDAAFMVGKDNMRIIINMKY